MSESKLGKVPSASKADTATSASTAVLAGNANTLGGKSAADLTVKCPAGTDLAGGMCIELVARPNAVYNPAAISCGTRALPTPAALIAFISTHPGLTGIEWTSNLTSDAAVVGVIGMNMANAIASVEINNAHPYRCAALPSN